jgi:hypothetical protein
LDFVAGEVEKARQQAYETIDNELNTRYSDYITARETRYTAADTLRV